MMVHEEVRAPLLIFGILLFGVLASSLVVIYNGIISLRRQVDRAWSNIEVILKQRFDEIPQLIEILERASAFEAAMVQALVDARSRYGRARNEGQKIAAARELSFSLKGVFALSEAFPELRSNEGFLHLQKRFSDLETHLADRREVYNEAVSNWNTKIFKFPEVFFSRSLGLEERALFEVSHSERRKPDLLRIGEK